MPPIDRKLMTTAASPWKSPLSGRVTLARSAAPNRPPRTREPDDSAASGKSADSVSARRDTPSEHHERPPTSDATLDTSGRPALSNGDIASLAVGGIPARDFRWTKLQSSSAAMPDGRQRVLDRSRQASRRCKRGDPTWERLIQPVYALSLCLPDALPLSREATHAAAPPE